VLTKPACAFLVLVFMLWPFVTTAMETDQFHRPPMPLKDIGDEISDHVEAAIRTAIANVNAGIAKHRGADAMAYETYKLLGSGTLLTTKIGTWMQRQKFGYKTTYAQSIYIAEPIDYVTISPTVNVYGVEFGTDKLEHIFQQGYRYYKISEDSGVKKAVQWGRLTERTYFGTMVSGVFSNGDLAANYAGMKFYQGLTTSVTIGDSSRPAILIQQDGHWMFNPSANLKRDLIRPFISEHLNEALNPSVYGFALYPAVRHAVKTQACPQWIREFPGLSKEAADAVTNSLALWNGEDYGHRNGSRMVTIGGTCF
jgi:hypothetical protein